MIGLCEKGCALGWTDYLCNKGNSEKLTINDRVFPSNVSVESDMSNQKTGIVESSENQFECLHITGC